MDLRIASVLRHLHEDADLFSEDGDNLLELIEDYFDPNGKPNPTT